MEVSIPQVVLHDGVVWDHGNRSFEFIQRLFIPSLFEVGPSKAIDKIAVIGLNSQRALNRIDRFVESQTAFSIHIAQIIQGTRMLGIKVDGLLYLVYRGLE